MFSNDIVPVGILQRLQTALELLHLQCLAKHLLCGGVVAVDAHLATLGLQIFHGNVVPSLFFYRLVRRHRAGGRHGLVFRLELISIAKSSNVWGLEVEVEVAKFVDVELEFTSNADFRLRNLLQTLLPILLFFPIDAFFQQLVAYSLCRIFRALYCFSSLLPPSSNSLPTACAIESKRHRTRLLSVVSFTASNNDLITP